jgi:hypothetical protein
MLGIVLAFGTTTKLGSVDRDDWDLAGRSGWMWTSEGKEGLRSAFDNLHVSAMDRGQGGQNYATVFGQLYRWLHEKGDRSDHGPIKQLLRNYILRNMDVCVGRNLLGAPIARRRKYSVQSLALETGVHRQTLRKILIERRLIAPVDGEKPSSVLLVDAEKGAAAAAALGRSVPFIQLPEKMNATRPIASCLIDLGYLTPLFRSQGENKREKSGFDSHEISFVLNRLEILAPEMSQFPMQWVTLAQCTKRARIPMRKLLERIFAGEMKNMGRADGDRGFNALRIDIGEVSRLPT